MADPIISIRNLSKTFGSGEKALTALSGVSLDIYPGEIFGIIGLSGAGKSTLVRCMNLLERPTGGSVSVCGQNMTELSEKELRKARRSVSMVFQGFNLLMQRTALQNVMFPLELAGVSGKAAREKAAGLLETVGLGERMNSYPAALSGGQKQRVAIARALATDPKVLLCDEATSALDPETTLSVLSLLGALNARLGVTVVVITHEMRVVERICSRVAIIAGGRIAECGEVREVFRRPKSAAARRLVFPSKDQTEAAGDAGSVLRLAFDGSTTDRPIIAGMVLECGKPVNILYADTRIIDGKTYGHTVLQLPDDSAAVSRMKDYLDRHGISYSRAGEEEAV